jgi:hypothetical protein
VYFNISQKNCNSATNSCIGPKIAPKSQRTCCEHVFERFFHSNISRYGFFYFSYTIVCLIPFLNTFKPMRSNIASDDLQNYHNFKYINIYVVISTHLRTVESKVQMQKRLRLDHRAVIWLSLPTCLHFQPIGDEIDLSWQVDSWHSEACASASMPVQRL